MRYRSFLVLAAAVGLLALAGYPEGPPPAHTGGFGEPTCRQCHFDQPLNAPGGGLALDGLPEAYEPGRRYRLTVTLEREAMHRGGFQAALRFADGSPAGTLLALHEGVEVGKVDTTGVQYAQHTKAGTEAASPGTLRWTFAWIAPAEPAEPVRFHVAANAANDDASEFGDFIYVLEGASRAVE